MKPPFKVRLASTGNPDMGQDPGRRKYGSEPNKSVPVKSLRAAVEVCREFIVRNDLGGGNWSGGNITDQTGRVVAHVSYNGRVWAGRRDDWEPGTPELCAS